MCPEVPDVKVGGSWCCIPKYSKWVFHFTARPTWLSVPRVPRQVRDEGGDGQGARVERDGVRARKDGSWTDSKGCIALRLEQKKRTKGDAAHCSDIQTLPKRSEDNLNPTALCGMQRSRACGTPRRSLECWRAGILHGPQQQRAEVRGPQRRRAQGRRQGQEGQGQGREGCRGAATVRFSASPAHLCDHTEPVKPLPAIPTSTLSWM